jgi:uncharacterized protein YbdZ (MbtH family)
MKNKVWKVALDRPGQGWSMQVEASSKKAAIKLAEKQMGETPAKSSGASRC